MSYISISVRPHNSTLLIGYLFLFKNISIKFLTDLVFQAEHEKSSCSIAYQLVWMQTRRVDNFYMCDTSLKFYSYLLADFTILRTLLPMSII